jgi:8-oxo-dGTP pyrophosphatase MutT (NUDIX family)
MKSSGLLIDSFGKYLICHASQFNGSFSRNDGNWGIPKGIVEYGDSLLDTAFRETIEETGLNIRNLEEKNLVVVNRSIILNYRTSKKTVYAFYVRSEIDLTKSPLKCISRIDGRDLPENDAFAWVDWETARAMVSKRQKELFSEENRVLLVDNY